LSVDLAPRRRVLDRPRGKDRLNRPAGFSATATANTARAKASERQIASVS
jgi:hypothetical protein